MSGLPSRVLITDMNQPLAQNAGNALEMGEAIEFLTGGYRQPRLEDVVFSIGREMLLLGGLAKDKKAASSMLLDATESGRAAEHFARMVSMQGGPIDLMEQPAKYLQGATLIRPLEAPRDGCIEYMDTRAIGLSIIDLGGGRSQVGDVIDHRVGLSSFRLVGETVNKGDPIVTIHATDETSWQMAADALLNAIVVGRTKDALPAVYEQFG